MPIAKIPSNASPPDVRAVVSPVLSCLPAAAVSTEPAPVILPSLSPILRQRAQLLASASTEPWIRLLSYDPSQVPQLTEIAQRDQLQPHPVSGEIEVDWDYDVQVRFRRLDMETLQALVVMGEFELFFRLVYCTGDQEGGGDGWRVGEVGPARDPSVLSLFSGQPTIAEAEQQFDAPSTSDKVAEPNRLNGLHAPALVRVSYGANGSNGHTNAGNDEEEDDDDDDYWARYDATPGRSPGPQAAQAAQPNPYQNASAEDAYYARYDSVQPAMDNHDPDEEAGLAEIPPPLGLAGTSSNNNYPASDRGSENATLNETSGQWTFAGHLSKPPAPPKTSHRAEEEEKAAGLIHPRAASSASSNGSVSIAKLEEAAEKKDQGEFGVKQHVSRSIRSLFLLSRASGIDREEFERMVRTELDVLGLVEDSI